MEGKALAVEIALGKTLGIFAAIFAFFAFGYAHAGDGWTGFYAGGNAGYAWGHASTSLSIADGPTGATCHFCFASDMASAQAGGSPGLNPDGFTGGAQVGYNWQTANLVYGVELDFESFSQHQTVTNSVALPGSTASVFACGIGTTCAGNISTSIKTDWLLTLRPRIGYTWANTLVYLTGGLALTQLTFSQSYADNITFGVPPNGSLSTSASQTKAGWVVGGGLEQALADHWSVKAEYLFVRFDGLQRKRQADQPGRRRLR